MCAKGRTLRLGNVANREHHIAWLEKNCEASAGPRASVSGMRKSYWGQKALIVSTGSYIYLMAHIDDGRNMPWLTAL